MLSYYHQRIIGRSLEVFTSSKWEFFPHRPLDFRPGNLFSSWERVRNNRTRVPPPTTSFSSCPYLSRDKLRLPLKPVVNANDRTQGAGRRRSLLWVFCPCVSLALRRRWWCAPTGW